MTPDRRLALARERRQLGDLAAASMLLEQLVAELPDLADAWSELGEVQMLRGSAEAAARSFAAASRLRPGEARVLAQLGLALNRCGRPAEGLPALERAAGLDPALVPALAGAGAACLALGRGDEAIVWLDRAAALRPDHASTLNNLGVALARAGRHESAVARFDRAIQLKPDYAYALGNRGASLLALGRVAEAQADYDRAVALRPADANLHASRGSALRAGGVDAEALAAFEHALRLDPRCAGALYGRGLVLARSGRAGEAAASLRAAAQADPDEDGFLGEALALRMRLCDWEGIDADVAEIARRIARGQCASSPFHLLAAADDAALHADAARLWTRQFGPSVAAGPARRRGAGGRIRLGYFSADLHEHATAYLAAELFELHDRARFEVIAYSFGPATDDPMQRRLRSGFDAFHDVRHEPDARVAAMAREHGIDIAIDLKGYTEGARAGIFARRAAPLQVGYLGYPGTMSAPFIEYLLADAIVLPPGSRRHYAEAIVELPGSYQVNDRKRPLGARSVPRSELGLPDDACVFCCFNQAYKIQPRTFDVWMRVLSRVPGSVLWLLQEAPETVRHLRREAERRGIAGERLLFAPRAPLAEHLARFQAADLFLDSWPYNAHTTASDALWAGVPVLTLSGTTFASRVAASLLHAAGLPELVMGSEADFEDAAVRLAFDRPALAALRSRLADDRFRCALFDTPRFVRNLELAFESMQERIEAGLPPSDLRVVEGRGCEWIDRPGA